MSILHAQDVMRSGRRRDSDLEDWGPEPAQAEAHVPSTWAFLDKGPLGLLGRNYPHSQVTPPMRVLSRQVSSALPCLHGQQRFRALGG